MLVFYQSVRMLQCIVYKKKRGELKDLQGLCKCCKGFEDAVIVAQPSECCTHFKMLKSSGAFVVLPLFEALPEFF